MPRFDGSGPAGYGRSYGMGLGFCGRRSGRGTRFLSPKNKLMALEAEEEELKKELEMIREERLTLEKESK